MRSKHPVPFGAEVCPGGGVGFHLGAPTAARVDLCLEGVDTPMAMQRDPAGWARLVTDLARLPHPGRPGDRPDHPRQASPPVGVRLALPQPVSLHWVFGKPVCDQGLLPALPAA